MVCSADACTLARSLSSTPTFEKWAGKKGKSMAEKALAGAVGGAGATAVLSALRKILREVGAVYKTAPMQVVDHVVHCEEQYY